MNKIFIIFSIFLALNQTVLSQTRDQLFFREDWKETEAELPVNQTHVANANLILNLYGPGRDKIKKSNHPNIPNDPFYIWSGECGGNWAVSLRHRNQLVDLSGPNAHVKWRSKQSGFRQLRVILKLADGTWLVGDQYDDESNDWREKDFKVSEMRWRSLNIDTVIEGNWVEKPDLSRVEEIGFTDLMVGGQSRACSRLDWMEVHGKPVRK